MIVAAFSLLLRAQSEQRVRDLDDLRSAERRELARELHDVVAHHVTGIVVQTKAARFAAQDPGEVARNPGETAAVLERIEREATEALGAMRRLVAVMRRADPGRPATTAPGVTAVVRIVRRDVSVALNCSSIYGEEKSFSFPPASTTLRVGRRRALRLKGQSPLTKRPIRLRPGARGARPKKLRLPAYLPAYLHRGTAAWFLTKRAVTQPLGLLTLYQTRFPLTG
ncbi:histidine kinase [Streptomyces venezuelae]|uniref:histidine kinase n=1 Tax=Streptomyces venezuelae TaxID=54571 RepID=UPI001CC2346F|nr:histidine kinase dimerization/phosphoacceptor domain-containing protein [Streptomyces venezuelae]